MNKSSFTFSKKIIKSQLIGISKSSLFFGDLKNFELLSQITYLKDV